METQPDRISFTYGFKVSDNNFGSKSYSISYTSDAIKDEGVCNAYDRVAGWVMAKAAKLGAVQSTSQSPLTNIPNHAQQYPGPQPAAPMPNNQYAPTANNLPPNAAPSEPGSYIALFGKYGPQTDKNRKTCNTAIKDISIADLNNYMTFLNGDKPAQGKALEWCEYARAHLNHGV